MTNITHQLALATGLRESDVEKIMATAPIRYKTFSVLKRNGEARLLAQPAREVKLIQRALIDILLKTLPVHKRATGYRSGSSILDNALPHAGHRPIIKMDFKDFFPSITAHDWSSYCRETGCITEPRDIMLTSLLLFYRSKGSRVLRLAIGAPSSPVLSNILLYEFDKRIEETVCADNVEYTRYADDLTFSAPRTGYLVGVVKSVATVVRHLNYPKLEINPEKTTYVTPKYHRTVTGLTLANDGRITIGRNRKREINAMIHRYTISELPVDELQHLCGMLAFINSVEPTFLKSLELKYGHEMLRRIQAAGSIRPRHKLPTATNFSRE